ncbi:MAG: helix-turn-helix domain-containing protein [Acidobacteria bacterium]|nr:helix-turn-helix domain-containing protein [Acidobacteriota bacterium]
MQGTKSKFGIRECLEAYVSECLRTGVKFKDTLLQAEMEFVMQVLASTGYNVSKAAEILEINRNTLRKKIEQFKSFERFNHHQSLHSGR